MVRGMTPIDLIFLILLGFLVGIVSSMVGVGGGVFIVPALTLIFESEFTSQVAVGTSLAVIVFTSLASTLAYSRQKRIDYKIGLVSAVTTVPGASLGAYLTSFVSSDLLAIIFAFFLIFVALRMLFDFHLSFPSALKKGRRWRRVFLDSDGRLFEYEADILLAFALAFFGGLSSGFLGIGGGALVVPILHLAVNLPMHVAVATSMFIMIFTSISGVLTHMGLGNVKFDYMAYLALGVIFGAQLGARAAKRASSKHLKRVFGVVLIIVSLCLLWNFV